MVFLPQNHSTGNGQIPGCSFILSVSTAVRYRNIIVMPLPQCADFLPIYWLSAVQRLNLPLHVFSTARSSQFNRYIVPIIFDQLTVRLEPLGLRNAYYCTEIARKGQHAQRPYHNAASVPCVCLTAADHAPASAALHAVCPAGRYDH